jgi:hypothetical protein
MPIVLSYQLPTASRGWLTQHRGAPASRVSSARTAAIECRFIVLPRGCWASRRQEVGWPWSRANAPHITRHVWSSALIRLLGNQDQAEVRPGLSGAEHSGVMERVSDRSDASGRSQSGRQAHPATDALAHPLFLPLRRQGFNRLVALSCQSGPTFGFSGTANSTTQLVGEAPMKPTRKEDEKLAGLRKETLAAFALAALILLLAIAGGAALWTILVAAMRS